jgi:hypothetical protein
MPKALDVTRVSSPVQALNFPHRRAAHERQHAAKGNTSWFPGKSVDPNKCADSIGDASRASDARRSAAIMENQGDVSKVENLNYRRE